MENKKIYNDDVEQIVNDPKRQEAISNFYRTRKMRRNRKLLLDAAVYGAVALLFGLLGIAGWLVIWIALPVLSFGGLLSAFCFGRWFENGKCMGWK